MQPVVQISLDLTNITEALETAHMAIRAAEIGLPAAIGVVPASIGSKQVRP